MSFPATVAKIQRLLAKRADIRWDSPDYHAFARSAALVIRDYARSPRPHSIDPIDRLCETLAADDRRHNRKTFA